MKINILTLFPDMFAPLKESMLGRAETAGLVDFNIVNIRDFSRDKHNKADDYTFGGGQGLVMMPQPAMDALNSLKPLNSPSGSEDGCEDQREDRPVGAIRTIYMSPRGKLLDYEMLLELSRENEITIFCGHYEGLDQRVIDHFQMEEVSIGDYVLTGGELPAMVLIDAVARLIPGVLSSEESALEESIYSGLLEYPQYTQPREYMGMEVPEVLLSGNHKAIRLWRFEEALKLTRERRPDLFEEFVKNSGRLPKDEALVLEKLLK